MSNQSFKVKNSLHLTPQAVEPSGLEVGDLWMDIDGNLKRWDGSASQDVGSGGVGSVDIMFAQTLEQAVIGDFTTTGTVAIVEIATNPLDILQGKKTLKITHTGGASAEQLVEVPIKYRGKNVTLSLDVASDAQSGNLTLTVTDETNVATLINAESIQPQEAGQTSVKRSVSFNVPSDCEELKYKFTAVSESGAISLIDNVVIELTQMSKLDTTIETPIITEWQSYVPTFQGFGTPISVEMQWRQNGENVEIRGKFTTGTVTAVEARLGLPNGYTSADSVSIPSIQIVGKASRGAASTINDISVLAQPAINYVTFSVMNNASFNGLSSRLGTELISSLDPLSVFASLPIQGLQATETQSVSLAQTVLVQESDSFIKALGNAGQAITTDVTDIPFILTSSQGNSLQWNGASVTILEDGIYTFTGGVAFTASVDRAIEVYKNGVRQFRVSEPGSRSTYEISHNDYLNTGDIISFRAAAAGGTLSNSAVFHNLNITKHGALKQLNVSENQKIEIPTSELRMSSAVSRGATHTYIVKYDNIDSLRGDAFTVESDSTFGTRITIKKKGRLNINATLLANSANQSIYLTRNQTSGFTTDPTEDVIVSRVYSGAAVLAPLSWCGSVNVGDVFRLACSVTPTSTLGDILTMSFQEQEVSVSVTNVLPQFSESDSSVRVDTANGYGSTGTRIRRFSNVRDNIGNDIEYVPSAVNGDSFVVKSAGIYSISYDDNFSSSNFLAISKNANSFIANDVTTVPVELLLATSVTSIANYTECVSWEGYLAQGDVIRAHTQGALTGTNGSFVARFTISKVGKPNVTGVDVTPFAKIEYEVKQFIELVGGNGFGSTNTGVARFSTVQKNTNNGLISFTDSVTLGASFTVLKRCSLKISSSATHASAGTIYITKNATILTNTTPNGSIGRGSYSAAGSSHASSVVNLDVGDIVRCQKDSGGISQIDMVTIEATELRDAYQVIGGGVENTYSARIQNNGAASIISQSYPFIQSVVRNSAGNVTINLVTGFFTVAPSVIATNASITQTSADRVAQVYNSTTTSIGILTNGNGGVLDYDFNIAVTRQGSDYRTPSKAIGLPAQRIAVLNHELAPTVGSGTSTTGVWVTQNLTNVKSDTTGLVTSLASNLVTLPAGRYKISARQMFYGTQDSVLRIFNSTDNTELIVGTGSATSGTANDFVTGLLDGIITLNATKQIALQYRVALAGGTYSRGGMASNFGVNIESTNLVIEKIEE